MLFALLLSFLIPMSPAHAAVGLHVSGTRILESSGSAFVMRGTSHAHAWYPTQTGSFAAIKALGANTVRVVLSGGRWPANGAADVANIVSLCKQNKLICVLENHDTTGGTIFTFTNAAWNGAIPAGGSTTFGFIGTWNGTGTPPTPNTLKQPLTPLRG
jgi:hypothetical protein